MDHVEYFQEFRPLLFSIAYRMTGARFDAEDILQDTYLKFLKTPCSEINNPKGLLTTIVTRTAIDLYKSAHHKREIYKGVWLPEPMIAYDGISEE